MGEFSYTAQTIGLKAAAMLARALPEKSAYELGRSLGVLGYHLAGFRRAVAVENLRRAFGDELSAADFKKTAQLVFENLGKTAIEVFRFPILRKNELLDNVDCDNPGMFDEALAGGKGAILLSAHFGNWEMFAAWIAAQGYPIDVVVKPQRNHSADKFYNDLRRATGVGIIPTQKASKQIIVSLKKNRLVAILADQYAGYEGVPVKFFGRMTATHRGPAAIALKLNCPIYYGVFVRRPDSRHQAICRGPLEFAPSGNIDDDITALTQMYTAKLEEFIRRYPEQWLWTHRRWKDAQ